MADHHYGALGVGDAVFAYRAEDKSHDGTVASAPDDYQVSILCGRYQLSTRPPLSDHARDLKGWELAPNLANNRFKLLLRLAQRLFGRGRSVNSCNNPSYAPVFHCPCHGSSLVFFIFTMDPNDA